MIVPLLGGVGMFLLGMVLLTDGLKALAGNALRRILTRFVAGPVSGTCWGALVTALVQSSTATTLTTVGFVSAGLLTFPQAVGVIFGANLGTTSTGWIVSQLGFKVSLGSLSPPLVFVGAALRLLSRGRAAHAGTALAGFGLLFIGIDLLQSGMGGLAARVSPADFPGGGALPELLTRAILVAAGFVMTVVMQSSSASMATTLAAVSSGAIGFEQAAALIIGQNVGTTPTAVAAAIGAPAAAKRTALAHVLFNLLTAGVAFAALPWMLRAVEFSGRALGGDDAPTLLAGFHTAFNVLGVALLLPVAVPFARLIEWIVPERAVGPARFLSPAVAELGPVALEAARRALSQVVAEALEAVSRTLAHRGSPRRDAMPSESRAALDEVRRFVHRLSQSAQGPDEVARHAAILHAADHAQRLLGALRERASGDDPGLPLTDPVVSRAAATLQQALDILAPVLARTASAAERDSGTANPPLSTAADAVGRLSRALAEARKSERQAAFAHAATGALEPEAALRRIDALLWLDRVAYHLWRASHHLAPPRAGAAAAALGDDADAAFTA